MQRGPLLWLILAALLCGAGSAQAAQIRRDPARDVRPQTPQTHKEPAKDVLLQTIGMLAGQGLVFGHESLEGLFVRYENRLIPKEKAQAQLADAARYTALVIEAFRGRLMGQLGEQERRDLALLIGFYEAQGQAVATLAVYVRDGGGKAREAFQQHQERVAAIIHQISLGGSGQ